MRKREEKTKAVSSDARWAAICFRLMKEKTTARAMALKQLESACSASRMARSRREGLDAGKSAPERSDSGNRMRLTMAWKACVESMGQAMVKPSVVISKLMSRMTAAASTRTPKLGCTPASGVKQRKM